MTNEELKKEATEYALEWGDKTDGTYAYCRHSYLAGAKPREERIETLEKENHKLKLLVKALLYEINQIWDIDEMNQDVRKAAEQIEKEDNNGKDE